MRQCELYEKGNQLFQLNVYRTRLPITLMRNRDEYHKKKKKKNTHTQWEEWSWAVEESKMHTFSRI